MTNQIRSTIAGALAISLGRDSAGRRAPAWLCGIAAIAAALWTLTADAAQAEAFPFAPGNGAIVFVSDRDSVDANGDSIIQAAERNRDVYSIAADGSGLQRLTSDLAADTHPAVAPDGRRIAFTSDRSGGEDLYVMGFDGSGLTRITDRGASDREPSFSADGQRLAYSVVHRSTLPGGPSEGDIWTVNADGTETTRLTFERDLNQFDPAVSPDGSRIAFVAATPGGPSSSRDVMVMDADGSNVTNLTAANGGAGFEDADPAFSPDGSSIAFSSDRDGGTEVWVMDEDGNDPVQLTDQAGAKDQQPAFSPDGTKIAFTARRGARTDVYTMNAADGSGQTRVTDQTTLDEEDELASWQPVPPAGQLEAFIDSGPGIVGSDRDVTFTYTGLPSSQVTGLECRLDDDGFSECPATGISYSELADGKHVFRVRAVGSGGPDPEAAVYRFEIDTTRIVFAAGEGNDSEIYAVNPDGSGRVRLTDNAALDTEPALAPDGSRVAFISNRDGDNEVFVMNADGSGAVTKLTNNSAFEGSPAYSPDGSEIAFVTRRDGNLEVYAMNSDGTAPTNLTSDPAADSEPSFSGDGTKIAFESDRAAGNVDVYSMNADGTGTTRLTTDPSTDKSPDFSPNGKQIAFTRKVLDPGGALPSNDEIFVMSASGAGETNITNHPRGINDREPSYRPDGAKIAYQDQGDIYVQNPDGTGRTRVTSSAEALDSAPDWGPGPAFVDVFPPETRIDSGPGSLTNEPAPTFTFSSDDGGASFECKLDGGSFAPCTSPKSYSGLADGAHSFEVRAIDAAGNVDASPASRAFTVDTVAPNTTIDSGPSGLTNNASPSFGFGSSEGGSTFECRLDSGSFAPCTSPKSYSGLADGAHSFEVRATDQVGNVDASPASRAFTVDTVAPSTTIDSGPSGLINDASPSFGFSSNDGGASFECRLDGGSFAPCTSPKSYSGLADGAHSVEVRAIDAAGNVDASPASRNFTVDTQAPNTTIDSGPSGPTNDASPSFGFSSSEDGSSFECRLDGGSFAPCTSPKSYSGLADGAHSFEVRATDRAGNTDPTPAERVFTVDRSAPDKPTFTATVPGSPANDNKPLVQGDAAGPVQLYTSADCSGAPIASGTSAEFSGPGIAVAVADDTTTTFWATATDAGGKSSGCSWGGITYIEDSTVRASATAKRKQRQSGKKIAVKAKVKAQEESDAKARGTVEFGGKSYKLKRQTKSISSGKSKNLKLKLKLKTPKDARRIAKALDQGKKTLARITVKLIDEVGNVRAESFRVKLKR